MTSLRTITAIFLLLCLSSASASFWVSEFTGSADAYRIERDGERILLQQLMLLQAGDTIHVDDDAAELIVINEHNESIALTRKVPPFVVPESAAPPSLLVNIGNWMTSWWHTRANQSSSTLVAVSKGMLDPTALVAVPGENFLLNGRREIFVAWAGGSSPFEVQLTTTSGELIAQAANITEYGVTLPQCNLDSGQRIELRITDALGLSVVPITVVDENQLPVPARSVIELEVPDAIRFGNLALILSGFENWRFEALQIAQAYRLRDLEQSLLNQAYPQFSEAELERALGDNE
jgi:hypothetical protein